MRALLLAAAFSLFFAPSASAQVNSNGGASAIGGYDPVAYFTDHAPVRGSAEHAFDWHGGHWLFASEEHRALFSANPPATPRPMAATVRLPRPTVASSTSTRRPGTSRAGACS